MQSFKQYYRNFFETLGYPLTERSGTRPTAIATAEKRLGIHLPAALRDYYLVAGQERRFNRCHNRLLDPEAWSLNKQRLVFMEENQSVAWWGVSVRNPNSDDPAVHQGMNYDDSIAWCPEHRKCSVFLAVMLHYHAVDGGFRFCGMADAPEETDYRFEKHGWTFYGEVKSLQAYSRPHQVVCLLPPGNLPFAERWSVMAAAKSKRELAAIAEEIGLTFS